MLAPISSAAVATVWMLRLTCSEPADTTFAWFAVCPVLKLISWETRPSSIATRLAHCVARSRTSR